MRARVTNALVIAALLSQPTYTLAADTAKAKVDKKSSTGKKTKSEKPKITIPEQKMPSGFKEALVYQSMMIYDKAIPLYLKAIKDDPDFVSSYNNLAQCLIKRDKKGDKKSAQGYLSQALKIDPDNIGTLHTKALIEESDRNWEQAEESYRKILAVQPLNFRAVQNLSELLFEIGKRREAREVLTNVLKQDPPKQHKMIYQQALENLDKKIKEKAKSKAG